NRPIKQIQSTDHFFNCSACAEPHSPHHKIHFKKGGYHKGKQKTDTHQKVINMGCCSGVVT
ncbi:hypothetical protein F2N28_27220, partial [Escherichia coli]|nr:hypothetical protein [Escherichia coli]EFE8014441.1 hypothetical protein [Escherichia coli]